ncbi:glutathione hydrolase 1 proenzyme-like [Lineus longissimus]|uniref:glutathione hydrolase 1 proenzyme-like n=1 Tax=Lineus longissimus TaxID=88925 RepID=UPI002B4F1FD6
MGRFVLLFVTLVAFYAHCSAFHQWGTPLTECAREDYVFKRPKISQKCIGKEQVYSKAAVACESTACSRVGRNMLKRGGHAVDATIAVLLCLGVVNGESSGVGGGLMMTIYDRETKKAHALDGREVAPAAAVNNSAFTNDPNNTIYGAKSIGVPGVVAAMKEAHTKFGLLPWASLFEPAIKMCEQGFPLSFNEADALTQKDLSNHTYRSAVKRDPAFMAVFLNKRTGEAKTEGETFYCRNLATTYRLLRNDADFYTGPLAAKIVSEIQAKGGLLSLDDLKNYRAVWREPLFGDVAGHKYITTPVPSSGGFVPIMFNVLKGFNMTESDLRKGPEQLALKLHRFIETCKFAYAKRVLLGDTKGSREYLKTLMTKEFADETRSKINDDMTFANRSYYGKDIPDQRMKHSTSHVSILDQYGNAVSTTTSINMHFGSGVIGAETGIIYNNVMNDFSFPNGENLFGFEPTSSNYVKVNKRPMGTLAPFVMVDRNDDVTVVGGASGGGKILSTVVSVLQEMFIFNKGLKEAVDAERIHSQWIPTSSFISAGFTKYKEAIDILVKKGHTMHYYCFIPSGFHGIYVKSGHVHAYTDAKKFGCPAGF